MRPFGELPWALICVPMCVLVTLFDGPLKRQGHLWYWCRWEECCLGEYQSEGSREVKRGGSPLPAPLSRTPPSFSWMSQLQVVPHKGPPEMYTLKASRQIISTTDQENPITAGNASLVKKTCCGRACDCQLRTCSEKVRALVTSVALGRILQIVDKAL